MTNTIATAAFALLVGAVLGQLARGPLKRIDPDLCQWVDADGSAPYWIIPSLAFALCAFTLNTYPSDWDSFSIVIYVGGLLLTATIDMRFMLLPDRLTLPLLWAGLLVNIAGHIPLEDAVLGAAIGYTFLWAIFHVCRLVLKKEGMGYGDFKLTAAIGAWQGYTALLSVVLIASITHICISVISARRSKQKAQPFGPHLVLGAVLTLAFGPLV